MKVTATALIACVALLGLSNCASRHAMGSTNLDQFGEQISMCDLVEFDRAQQDLYGGVDNTISLPTGGYADIHEFRAHSDGQGVASTTMLSVLSFGVTDMGAEIVNSARVLDGEDCPYAGPSSKTLGDCDYARIQIVRYHDAKGRIVCAEQKKIHDGYRTYVNNISFCPSIYKSTIGAMESDLRVSATSRYPSELLDGLDACEVFSDETKKLDCMEGFIAESTQRYKAQVCS